jgi:hypothetical protein
MASTAEPYGSAACSMAEHRLPPMLDTTGNGPGGFLRITREGFPGESIRICEVPPPPGATSADSFFTQIADLPDHPRDPDALS